MLAEREEQFLIFWEKERLKQNGVIARILAGLPMAMLFGLPILILILAIYIYFPEWYTKISNTSTGTFVTIVIAVILCIIFFSYFRMSYKWELNEQIYQELKTKANKEEAANKV